MQEEDKEKVMSDDEIRFMLMAMAINVCTSSYDKTQIQVREFFFKLPATDMLSTWEWLNDTNKVKVISTNKVIFDKAVKEALKNGFE